MKTRVLIAKKGKFKLKRVKNVKPFLSMKNVVIDPCPAAMKRIPKKYWYIIDGQLTEMPQNLKIRRNLRKKRLSPQVAFLVCGILLGALIMALAK